MPATVTQSTLAAQRLAPAPTLIYVRSGAWLRRRYPVTTELHEQREVQLAAHLQHPNILPVLSTGAIGEAFYYVMPFVAGESLRQRLETGERFPIPEALRVLLSGTFVRAPA